MTIECLSAITWDDPLVFGPMAAAVIGGLFLVLNSIIKRGKESKDPTKPGNPTASTQITNAPKIEIENKPKNVFNPTVKVGLDEKHVGEEITKAVHPLAQKVSAMDKKVDALGNQLAEAQLAPKQPVPNSGDRLKVMAVEFFNAGWDAQNQGEIGQAIGHYLDTLKLDPAGAAPHINLGIALAAKNDLDGAIEHFNQALRIKPDSAAAHNNLGVALSAKGDLDGAIEHYNQALRIDLDHAEAHINLGNALKAKGDLDASIEHYNQALRIDPDKANAHTNLGVALAAKGDFDASIEHYNEALRIDPDYASAHYNLGCVLAQEKSVAAAVAALSRAIGLDVIFRGMSKSDTDYDPIRNDPAFRKLVYGE